MNINKNASDIFHACILKERKKNLPLKMTS